MGDSSGSPKRAAQTPAASISRRRRWKENLVIYYAFTLLNTSLTVVVAVVSVDALCQRFSGKSLKTKPFPVYFYLPDQSEAREGVNSDSITDFGIILPFQVCKLSKF
jgi:hypothetical protein